MATIEANTEGKIQLARKRLKQNIRKLKDAEGLSPSQREALQNSALIDLHLIELWRLDRASEVE